MKKEEIQKQLYIQLRKIDEKWKYEEEIQRMNKLERRKNRKLN
jgi:hypothetical protein